MRFAELRRLGYMEGENLLIERYSAEGHQSVGMESLMVIIAEAGDTRRTFHYLAQGSLPQALEELNKKKQERSGDQFEVLMQNAALLPEQPRGDVDRAGDATIRLYQWEVIPPQELLRRRK